MFCLNCKWYSTRVESWRNGSWHLHKLVGSEPLNRPAYYPWADLPTTPRLTCLLPLNWPAYYPWADLLATPELTCLLPLSWPAWFPWADLPTIPGLTCLLPLSWPAYNPWADLPTIPEVTCLLPLSWPACYPCLYLEDGEHGEADVIKGGDSIVGTWPLLEADWLVLSARW